jgi:4-alpha-glucanotransferase
MHCRATTAGASGDYTDLRRIAEWAGGLGADFVSTLPLLDTFLEAPFEPSPYSPASRLFWNELFVDVDGVPGGQGVAAEFADERRGLRQGAHVDYARVAACTGAASNAPSRTQAQ